MNKIFFFIFVTFSVWFSYQASAQNKHASKRFDKEAFEARRNAFITAEVGLTPEEASKFIPLCNELRQKMFEAGLECRKYTREIRRAEHPTEADYAKAVDVCLEVRLKEAELEKEYYEKFRRILSPEKLYKYRNAEYKFIREYMKDSKHGKDKNRKK